ncbi:MAG TPA: DUF1508 domain-containing protein, partial [Gemmatimonadaceae bacterium]|nr:DUF1508 domain-containing protein [Gemmatimonadaceae bacterium]
MDTRTLLAARLVFVSPPIREGTMAAHFELKKTANGQFMFNLKAGNGEIILTGSMHKDKEAAARDIEVV